MPAITLTIEGDHIRDIASFYDEINRVFMAGEDWTLGASLDALDDLLYGGYGALLGSDRAILIWRNMGASRQALGRDATRAHYLGKLQQPSTYDTARIHRDLDALESGTGPTYFEIILQIIADHPNITLRGM